MHPTSGILKNNKEPSMAIQIYASFKGVKQGDFKGESNKRAAKE